MPENVTVRDAALSPNVVIAAVVAIVAITAALVLGAIAVGLDARSTPIVSSVVGLVAPTAVALLALVRANVAERKTDAVNEKVDGHLSRLTTIATEAAAATGNPELVRRLNGETS